MPNVELLLTIVALSCAGLLLYCVVLLRRIDRGVEAVRILLFHDYDSQIPRSGSDDELETRQPLGFGRNDRR